MYMVGKLWSTLSIRFTEIFIGMSVCHVLKKFISQWKYLTAIWTTLPSMNWYVQLKILLGRELLITVLEWVWSVMRAVNMVCQKILLREAPLSKMTFIYSCSVDIKVIFC